MEELRVLIVDDMSSMRGLIKEGLRKSFAEAFIDEAADGKEAQEKLQRGKYDVVLCDWIMPCVGGNEVLRWLRRHATLGRMPFIMITSKGDKNSILQAMREGVDDYIVKPFTIESLVQKITSILNK